MNFKLAALRARRHLRHAVGASAAELPGQHAATCTR